MTSLFQLGDFVSSSGETLPWKIECDALTDADIETLAFMIRQMIGQRYTRVFGVLRGGLRLAKALESPSSFGPWLIVDDVLTTGGSMERMKASIKPPRLHDGSEHVIGVVIFARGPCPSWIKPLFRLPESLWVKK